MSTKFTKAVEPPATRRSLRRRVRRWLVAEYCDANFYSGWQLYLREKPGYQTRNKDGGWGWIRSLNNDKIVAFFATLGIELKEDWPCPEYGLAEFVKRYPLKGRKVGGEKRGGVKVLVGEWGDLTLAPNDESERLAR